MPRTRLRHVSPRCAVGAAALESFASAGNARGCFCVWLGVVDRFAYEWGGFTARDHWIECFERLRERYPHFPGAEGLAVYRRCAELLAPVLGYAPSAETEALFRALTRC